MSQTGESRIRCILAASLLALAPLTVHAADVPLVADTYISGAIPTLNFGGLANLNVGNAANNNVALLKFDLSVLPPAGIAKAILRVFVNKVGTPGAVDVLTVTSPWSESTITGQLPPTLGTMVATGVPVTTSGSYVYVDVTLIVQNQVALGTFYPNYGFAIMANASAPATAIFLDSKESTTTSHPATLDVTLVGPAGAQGSAGPAGTTGATGSTGAQGPQGLPGTAGAPGAQGIPGLTGALGPTGPQGPQGSNGIAGAQGPAGVAGAQGPAGAPGLQGLPGANGATGATGSSGAPGLNWRGPWNSSPSVFYAVGDAVSFNGSSYVAITPNNGGQPDLYLGTLWNTLASVGSGGAAGLAGAIGPQGIPGATGPQGLQGNAGLTGATGPQGVQGVAGATGAQGPTGPSHLYISPSNINHCSTPTCSSITFVVPPGSYFFQARVSVVNTVALSGGGFSLNIVSCAFVNNGTRYGDDGFFVTTGGAGDTAGPNIMFDSALLTANSNFITLECDPSSPIDMYYKLVITPVGGIN